MNEREEIKVVQHHGVFHKQISLFEGIALIVSATIGAGVLGIPYAVAKVGVPVGILYIVVLGFLMMGLNLLLGEVTIRTKETFQLSGLAGKYLGSFGKWFMTAIMYSALFGILVVYVIGEGQTLSELFGGTAYMWSLIFFALASIPIILGMRTLKVVEFVLTIAVLSVVLLIVMWSAPHVQIPHITSTNFAQLLFPYGVILFAYSSATSIPEVHSVLRNKNITFKKVIIYSSLITMAVYCLFAFMVVGVSGTGTTEIATIGLGKQLGSIMFVLGNVFAALAMGTSFMVIGLSLRDSMQWDFNVKKGLANIIVLGVPLVIFLLGLRQFIAAIDFVGGVLVSTQLILIILIYLKAKKHGDIPVKKYGLHNTMWLVILLILAFSVGAVYSITKLF